MNLLGVKLTLLIGRTVPVPVPLPMMENLDTVEVTQSDTGQSGFQITFKAGRSGPIDILDYQLLGNPLLMPHNRAVIIVTLNAIPRVLMDGIILDRQLNPSTKPGASTITLSGKDVSIMMDKEQKPVERLAQNEFVAALMIIAQYAQYGLIPMVMPPFMIDFPLPMERTPVQRATDLQHLQNLAGRFGYVFYIKPGPAPLMNTAYWGPPVRVGIPKKALSVNLGGDTNVERLDFRHDAKQASTFYGKVHDRNLNQHLPFETFASLRIPPLALFPAVPFDLLNVRRTLLDNVEGLNYAQAFAKAQAETDKSMDSVLTATGELDTARYGDLLEARGLVGLRGAGFSYDGFYYVQSVSHSISTNGAYKQRFTLTREGVGSTTPVVPVL